MEPNDELPAFLLTLQSSHLAPLWQEEPITPNKTLSCSVRVEFSLSSVSPENCTATHTEIDTVENFCSGQAH